MRWTSTLLRCGEISFHLACHTGRLALRTLAHRVRRSPTPFLTLLGEELSDLFEALGATFVKLGQILSSRPDLLSPEVAFSLARLQDEVAPFAEDQVPVLLAAAFGRPPGEVFARFEPQPLASASVAQVHRAELHDGREVAVKIRRPGVVSQVERDVCLARFVVAVLARLPPLRPVPLAELVEELAAPILQQLDFAREAASLRRFRANFAHSEHVTLPAPVEELCTGSVLTLEYLGGLEKVTSRNFSAEERRTAALAGLRALYKMIFLDGFVHADLHPGNVFLRRWGEIVLLDTGLVAELNEQDLRDFVDFFFGLVNNQGSICARILYDNATWRSPRCDRGAFEAAVVDLVAHHAALRSRDFEVTRFVYQLIETQRRFGVRGSTKFIMTVLAMVVYDGICKQLYPECEFQREARGFLITARYRRNRSVAV
jgi:ubiquinone biosynthesis protein